MLYIFDKDGTLVTKKSGGNPPIPNSVEEQVALPGVVEKCAELRAQGHTLAIASNQGGVAWGFIDSEQAVALMRHAANLICAKGWCMCPHHPKGRPPLGHECYRRKPAPGMLLDLMQRLHFEPADTTMIGDMESDRDAAAAAGVKFVWADEFFYGDCREPASPVGPDVDLK